MKNYADKIIKILNKSYYIYNTSCSCFYWYCVKIETNCSWKDFFKDLFSKIKKIYS